MASVLAATCITKGVSSPAILYMSGIIRRSPCDAVNVVVNAPAWSAPCTAPAAPASDCISVTETASPHMFFLPAAAHVSHSSAMGDDGVIGYMATTSLRRNATEAAASFPSIVTAFFVISYAPFLFSFATTHSLHSVCECSKPMNTRMRTVA